MVPPSESMSAQAQEQLRLPSSESSIPELSRWDSHPIRTEKHSSAQTPDCPRRSSSFDGITECESFHTETTTESREDSRRKLDLQVFPPRRPTRRSSAVGDCSFHDNDTSSSCGPSDLSVSSMASDATPSTGSSSALSLDSLLVDISPLSRSNENSPCRWSNSVPGTSFQEHSMKVQSDRLSRPCIDLTPKSWMTPPSLPKTLEYDTESLDQELARIKTVYSSSKKQRHSSWPPLTITNSPKEVIADLLPASIEL
ncbi:expressed unknown protein [Seminavis robusta]|uniref:Uncharacterized protein n=1 Tax=Seminavis robusta TaxID=568900 RepID=A0A9N8EEJ7_9STRA|nr:expressed unknown protein [Seminavis robusta]|eukprot:Sro1037_g234190.1 n/a (255) ;mRNA; r:25668-26432